MYTGMMSCVILVMKSTIAQESVEGKKLAICIVPAMLLTILSMIDHGNLNDFTPYIFFKWGAAMDSKAPIIVCNSK